jgi:hypothetical protein
MRLRRLGFVCAFAASILAACGSSNLLGTTTTTQSAIRFINGSPDLNTAGGVDVYLSGTANSASASALTYGKASALSYVNSQTYTITVTPAGNKGTTSLSCTTPSLIANTRYTVVIAGKVAPTSGTALPDTLQCQIFPETIYSLPGGSFQLAFHNAAPALTSQPNVVANADSVGFGIYTPTPPQYSPFAGPLANLSALSTTAGVGPVAQNALAVNVLPGGVVSGSGVGVYASDPTVNPPTAGSVYGTILPSALQAGFTTAVTTGCPDTQNFFPIQTPSPTPSPASTTAPTPTPTPVPACTVTSNVMSVYAIDAPAGSGPLAKLVGVTD